MKTFLLLLLLTFSSIECSCQNYNIRVRSDTLLKIKNASLLLDNGFAIPSFSVSGDIYLTDSLFIFYPKPYRKRRYEMYNDMVNSVNLCYDSILTAKRVIINGMIVSTRKKKYRITDVRKKQRKEALAIINRKKRS